MIIKVIRLHLTKYFWLVFYGEAMEVRVCGIVSTQCLASANTAHVALFSRTTAGLQVQTGTQTTGWGTGVR